ncbi:MULTISPECIES: GH25 family lysozyme [unclassified Bacillus cereus group]|uniref:GH25 family lysozyme n=1 Tax=unclassified Bacillus cereus group TaxID=2750818 RepID=UPI001F5AF665|nr:MULTISPECIES: GH25 family lysozyme [unclassified Bacillus cereus group]
MEKHIVDLSKWNGDINWDVAAPQIALAICRVQYGSRTADEQYKNYVANLEKRGVPHGAYAYGCFVSVQDAIVEAKDFMARTSPNAKFLVLDVEDDTLKSCGPDQLAAASQAFIQTCKAAGWKVGFYVSHHMYNKYGLSGVKADFLWLPRYGGNKPAYECDIWQYTETGNVPGIGKCDLNYLIGNKNLSWFVGGGVSLADDGRRKIKTGGLGIGAIKEVSEVLVERNIKATIIFEGKNGNPYVLTEKMSNPEMDKFTAWLDERGWYYEYLSS